MKKLIKVGAVLIMTTIILAACSSKEGKDLSNSSEVKTEGKKAVEVTKGKDFSDVTDKGDGQFNLQSPSGNTEDGVIPVVFYDKNVLPTAIGYSTSDINGGQLSYLYVDGVLLDKKQLGTSQGELHLQSISSAITSGIHTIQLVQYADDSEDGEVIAFKLQQYEIKE